MALLAILVLALSIFKTNSEVLLNYTEVQKLGNSCPQLESCGHGRSRELFTIKEKNCVCDDLCVEYGDCCIDAPKNSARNTSTDYSCYELKQFGGVFMKDTCSPAYDGSDDIRYLCEATKLGDLSDPLGSIPVTDTVTGFTYKNYYCSICNKITDNIVLWTPRLECPTVKLLGTSENITKEYVYENLSLVGNSWGLYLTDETEAPFFHDCEVDPVMPSLLESKIRLCKPDLVSDCAPDWKDEDVRVMCKSYMGARYIHGGEKFRNAHCALCNGMNVTHLSCQSVESRGWKFRTFESHAFSLLLDVSERKGEDVGIVQMCEKGEVFDPFFKICRSLTCLPGYIRKNKICVLKAELNDSIASQSGEGPIISVNPEVVDLDSTNKLFNPFIQYRPVSDTSEENIEIPQNISGISNNTMSISNNNSVSNNFTGFQNCLLISLTDSEYVIFPNKSAYVPRYDKLYEPTSYYLADGIVFVCSHLVSEGDVKFLPLMGYLTVSGLGVSMVCLFIHFVAFWIVPDLQNLSGKNLVSQCVSLFCAYSCFIIGLMDSLNYASCSTLAFLTFYFFQVSFFWMAVMAFDVWRTLRMATTELRVTSGKQLRRFVSYSCFAWVTPFLILTIMACAEFTDAFPLLYRPNFANPRCWFKHRRALLVFFAAPLIAILVSNVVLFVSSSRMILMTTQSATKQQTQANRRNFKLYLRLALLMGLTWIVGIVAGYADIDILWYFFVFCNTLQGLFIFVAFTCSTKVVNFVREKIRKTCKPRDSSHSASTGSGCHTSSTNLHPNLAKKFSSKLLLKKKDSASTTSSSSINGARQNNSPL